MMPPQIFTGLDPIEQKKFLIESGLYITTPLELLTAASKHFDVSIEKLVSNSRKREYVLPRQMIMYAIMEIFPDATLKGLGRLFNRDHSTIIYAIQTVKNLRKVDKGYDLALNQFVTRMLQ